VPGCPGNKKTATNLSRQAAESCQHAARAAAVEVGVGRLAGEDRVQVGRRAAVLFVEPQRHVALQFRQLV
jgi:hypothetical protein